MTIYRTPVLIAGAGFAGLTAAVLLAFRGVPCTLVERHASTSRYPKARGINPRSLELLRAVPGLEADLHKVSRAAPHDATIAIAETVTGRVIATFPPTRCGRMMDLSPSTICRAGQDRVEAVLLRYARSLGADVRFSTTLCEVNLDRDGVRAALRTDDNGKIDVLADYLIAADGSASFVRQTLGIEMHGEGRLAHLMSIFFEADLSIPMQGRGFALYYLRNSNFTGAFVSCDDPRLGQIHVEYDPAETGAAVFNTRHCEKLIRAMLGMPDLDVKILGIRPWTMSALLASRMREGRVFLSGDAAHIVPTVGGLGGQTAIQDSADLAWKLALVLRGDAGSALLDTYETERRPAGKLAVERALANYVERLRPGLSTDLPVSPIEWDTVSAAMGYRYHSAAILSDPGDDGSLVEDPRRPTGRPGTRLPHVSILCGGRLISTHDLIGNGFVLLAGPDAVPWEDAARHISARSGAPLAAYRAGAGTEDKVFLERTGIETNGALLVRPDGFIAWRSRAAQSSPTEVLESALARILCRGMSSQKYAA